MHGLNGLSKKFLKFKHRAPRPVFCPKCKSFKIKLKESYGILPHVYRCSECDYEGHLVLELEEE